MKKKETEPKPITIDFNGLSNTDLFSVRVQVEKEFKKRNLKFDKGDIGEAVTIDFFNRTPGLTKLLLAPKGTKNVDAISRDGERYSIKTIKDGSKTGTIYPDTDNKAKQLFEHLLLAQLDENYELKSLHRFTWNQFLKVRCWDKRMNAWYIPKSLKALKESTIIL
jgi:hypothetical protein